MNKIEQRHIQGALRLDAEDEGGIIGLAAVYYRDGDSATEYRLWKGAVERIAVGAFTRAAAEDDVRALFNHDPNALLGRTRAGTLTLSADADGLRYRIAPASSEVYSQVAESLRRGDLDGSSFSFEVLAEEWEKDGDTEIRWLKDVRLYDVGPVTFPAYEATESGIRSAVARRSWEDLQRERDRELDRERIRQQLEAVRRRNLRLTIGRPMV